jgi:hypothetical protein
VERGEEGEALDVVHVEMGDEDIDFVDIPDLGAEGPHPAARVEDDESSLASPHLDR